MKTLSLCAFILVLYSCENTATGAANLVGPYRQLSRNPKVVEEVFASRGRLYMLLKDEFRGKEVRVRISDARNSQYRKWPDGREDRIIAGGMGPNSPVKDADWIETKAPFIEYWMEGKLVLHLMRVRKAPTRPSPSTGLRAGLADLPPEERSTPDPPPEGKMPEAAEERLETEIAIKKVTKTEVDIEKGLPYFGPYHALVMDQTIVRDVKVDEERNTYIKLNPKFRKNEIRVKISNSNKAGYREWDYGGLELVSPAEAGRPPGGWTDWIQVEAKYVEYWMGDKLILHLMRTDI